MNSQTFCVFGAASIKGHALGFHALTDNGAAIWRLPLHAFCHQVDAPPAPLDWLQFWDCFSYEMCCTTFDRLQDAGMDTRTPRKPAMAATNALT